jgi:hypothetical protein
VCRLLLACEAKMVTEWGVGTALHLAAISNQLWAVKLLVERGADVGLEDSNQIFIHVLFITFPLLIRCGYAI